MRPADDPRVDYKTFVRGSYDRCSASYAASRVGVVHPELELLGDFLDDGASVLDVGCGSGVPVTRALARRFAVTGVDISSEMIRRAEANVPAASFVRADITSIEFADSTFDAVVAFYSIFHIPREEQSRLFRRIRGWLKPGGYLMCTLSRGSETGYTEDDFIGETMYWSNYGLAEYEEMLTGLGFRLIRSSTIGHGFSEVTNTPPEEHPLVLATLK